MTSNDLNKHLTQQKAVPIESHTQTDQPYRLTFFIDNDTDARGLQLTDFGQSHLKPEQYYDDLVVEGYEGPQDRTRHVRHATHEPHCVLSAFLYFITITTVVYLAVMWVRRQIHIQMERFQWW